MTPATLERLALSKFALTAALATVNVDQRNAANVHTDGKAMIAQKKHAQLRVLRH